MPYADEEQGFERVISPLLGVNTAAAPTTLLPGQWRYMLNGYQSKIGACATRPGSVPVTTSPLSGAADRLTVYRSGNTEKLLATSGTTLYKLNGTSWVACTGTLTSSAISDVNFTDANLNSRKIIADGGALKEFNSTTDTVSAITPAADDPAPAPANGLGAVNAKGIKYVFSYSGHIFVTDGSDTWYYTKRFTRDYIPTVQYERWVRENDYMNGPGIAFDNVALLPMRRGWGILLGSTFDDFQGNLFLNTSHGVIAPRSVARITYPNGSQTIAYLSDDGPNEIYDTGNLDSGSRRYSTRPMYQKNGIMTVDFKALGLSDAEKTAAIGYYDESLQLYILKFNRGSERLAYTYDVRDGEWRPWNNIKANGFANYGGKVYYAGETGHAHVFDDTLAYDYNDAAKTTGTAIDWDNITDVLQFENTGYPSYLDYLIVLAKQYAEASTIDIWVRTFYNTTEIDNALRNEIMIWGIGVWGTAVWYNVDLSDLVGKPKRIVLKKKSPFFQIRFRNNKGQRCELQQYKLTGRTSGG